MDLERALLLLSDRPELINTFPDWLLPSHSISQLKDTSGLAIAEIAGRDSVAAILLAIEQGPIRAVLPTIAYTGTEFGDWRVLIDRSQALAERLERQGVRVFAPVLLGSPKFWSALCGRYITVLFSRYGFYTPCLGCHLYFHALRIPLAKLAGAAAIISGEREQHDGSIKLNQLEVALDAYVRFVRRFDIDLLLPLRYINEGKEIERILGHTWAEGDEQLGCVLSQNYQDVRGEVVYDPRAISRFLEEFALPVTEAVVQDYLAARTPDYVSITRHQASLLRQ